MEEVFLPAEISEVLFQLKVMGRKKHTLQKIEKPSLRQATYTKRKDSILKKAEELSILCDVNVAVMMFSPSGRLNTFARNGRIEDAFIRYLRQPDESKGGQDTYEEHLVQRLIQSKHEGEMLEKMATIEALEAKLGKVIQQKHEATSKMGYYEPNVENIRSVLQAEIYEEYLTNAIKNIQLLKTNLTGKEIVTENFDRAEERAAVNMEIEDLTWGVAADANLFMLEQLAAMNMEVEASTSNQAADANLDMLKQLAAFNADIEASKSIQDANTNNTSDICGNSPWKELDEGTTMPAGPHLTLDFIKAQTVALGWQASSSHLLTQE